MAYVNLFTVVAIVVDIDSSEIGQNTVSVHCSEIRDVV